jgi:hypothetical protein
MRSYVTVTGIIFMLLVLAHIWRATSETHLVREPFFILATVVPALLAIWAFRLLATLRRAGA